MSRGTLHVALLVVLCFCMSATVWAQATGTINGTVYDKSGAVVPGAGVTIVNQETNQTRSVAADGGGKYTVTFLPVGVYSVKVEKPGFALYLRKDLLLEANTTVQSDAQLEVRGATEQVNVTAEAPLVQATSTTLVQIVDTKRVQDLPLNGRNVLNLMTINAGVSTEGAVGNTVMIQNLGTAVTASMNGSRGDATNFLLDNGDNNDRFTNVSLPFPNPDAVKEVSIQTSTFDAQYGRALGGVVNVATKSGTNQPHATLFEYLRNYELNAANRFSGRDTVKRNQFGGSLGAPVFIPKLYNGRNRSFFFFSYQGTRLSTSTPGVAYLTPTVAMKQGDFSAWLLSNGTGRILDPLTRQPFPNNLIPVSRFDPVSQKMLALIPPSAPGANYQIRVPSQTNTNNDDQVIGRFDQQLTKNQRASVRVFQFFQESPWNYAKDNVYTLNAGQQAHSRNVTANHSWLLSPKWVNDFNYTHNVTESNSTPPEDIIARSLAGYGARVKVLPTMPTMNLSINGWSPFNIGTGYTQVQKNDQVTEVLNYASGRHNLRFGPDLRRYSLEKTSAVFSGGQIAFTGQLFSDPGRSNAGNAFAEFVLGQAATWRQQSQWSELLTNQYFSLFLQDDWRVTSRFTLNLGLRWDPQAGFKEDFDNKQGTFGPGMQSQRFPNAPRGVLYPGDPGIGRSVVLPDRNNLAPRVGVAYQITPRTVVRSGYGVFYNITYGFINNGDASAEPFVKQVTLTGPVSMSDPYNGGTPLDPTPIKADASFKFSLYDTWFFPGRHMPTTYMQNWNFIVERQVSNVLIRAGYVGSKGTHLLQAAEINPAIYGPGANASNINQRRIYQPIGNIQLQSNDAWSRYHALQLTVQRRLSRGFSILGNYTWAKAIDRVSSVFSTTGPDPFNYNHNAGPSDFDLTHRLVVSGIWQTPALRTRPLLVRQILGGWQSNFIFTANTGLPFTVYSGVDNTFSGIVGQQFADLTGQDWRIPGDRSKAARIATWFNTAAFRTDSVGVPGTEGRNQLRSPGAWNADYSLFKTFPIRESLKLQFRAEAFNLLNHPNLGRPDGTVISPTFGRISSVSAPRIMQMALRLSF